MANQQMRRYSAALAECVNSAKDVQIETTMRSHYTPSRMVKISNSDKTKC